MLTIILNAQSGAAVQADADALDDLFRSEGVESRTLKVASENLVRTVHDAAAEGDTLIAAGGDGTVGCVAGAIAGTEAVLGILPLGTLNHFAKTLNIPMDLAGAVKTIAARHVVRADIGYVNDRPFINNSSIGLYPDIVEVREQLKRQGRNKWTALAMATAAVLARDTDVFVRFETDGAQTVTRTPFLFVGNNEYTVEGIHFGSRARLDDGRLYVYVAPRLKAHHLPKLFLRAIAGRIRTYGGFSTQSSRELWVDTPESRHVAVATDGEVAMERTPLRYRSAPGALRVIVPAE